MFTITVTHYNVRSLLGMVMSVCTCWLHNVVTLFSGLVSNDFGTCSYWCFIIIIIIIITTIIATIVLLDADEFKICSVEADYVDFFKDKLLIFIQFYIVSWSLAFVYQTALSGLQICSEYHMQFSPFHSVTNLNLTIRC